ncbi:MAG: GFA family protein [Alphaproteobacteria bacterium]
MTGTSHLTGHCLCGDITYRVPFPFEGEVSHCHCKMCRRAAGAVVVTWFTVRADTLELTGKPLKVYKSSEHGERGNCPTCGTPVTFRSSHYPGTVDVTLATLDHPEDIAADNHIYTESRLPWLVLDAHLPDRADDSDEA